MILIEIFLPISHSSGRRFTNEPFDLVKEEMTRQFGGVTAFTRSPAEGLWRHDASVEKDTSIIYEVMAQELDSAWWRNYIDLLKVRFDQEEILARATVVQ